MEYSSPLAISFLIGFSLYCVVNINSLSIIFQGL